MLAALPGLTTIRQVSAAELRDAPEPSDRQVWEVCPYLRNFERCQGCPVWEDDPCGEQIKRGCRLAAEEACRVVMAAQVRE